VRVGANTSLGTTFCPDLTASTRTSSIANCILLATEQGQCQGLTSIKSCERRRGIDFFDVPPGKTCRMVIETALPSETFWHRANVIDVEQCRMASFRKMMNCRTRRSLSVCSGAEAGRISSRMKKIPGNPHLCYLGCAFGSPRCGSPRQTAPRRSARGSENSGLNDLRTATRR
jgi:hypothetical protein